MTTKNPRVGVTTTSHYFWRKFQAKTFRMSYPALILVDWVLQNVICIGKKTRHKKFSTFKTLNLLKLKKIFGVKIGFGFVDLYFKMKYIGEKRYYDPHIIIGKNIDS